MQQRLVRIVLLLALVCVLTPTHSRLHKPRLSVR